MYDSYIKKEINDLNHFFFWSTCEWKTAIQIKVLNLNSMVNVGTVPNLSSGVIFLSLDTFILIT